MNFVDGLFYSKIREKYFYRSYVHVFRKDYFSIFRTNSEGNVLKNTEIKKIRRLYAIILSTSSVRVVYL